MSDYDVRWIMHVVMKSMSACDTLTAKINIHQALSLQTTWHITPLYSSSDRRETAGHGESERQFKKASSCNYWGSTPQPPPAGIRLSERTVHNDTHTQNLSYSQKMNTVISSTQEESFISWWNDEHALDRTRHTHTIKQENECVWGWTLPPSLWVISKGFRIISLCFSTEREWVFVCVCVLHMSLALSVTMSSPLLTFLTFLFMSFLSSAWTFYLSLYQQHIFDHNPVTLVSMLFLELDIDAYTT